MSVRVDWSLRHTCVVLPLLLKAFRGLLPLTVGRNNLFGNREATGKKVRLFTWTESWQFWELDCFCIFRDWKRRETCFIVLNTEYMSMYHVCAWCPWRSEKGVGSLRTVVTDGCETPCGCLLGNEFESSIGANALDYWARKCIFGKNFMCSQFASAVFSILAK